MKRLRRRFDLQPREAVPESGRSHCKQPAAVKTVTVPACHAGGATATAALPRRGSGAAVAGAAARGPVASDRDHHGARASATHWQAGSARTRADSDASAIMIVQCHGAGGHGRRPGRPQAAAHGGPAGPGADRPAGPR